MDGPFNVKRVTATGDITTATSYLKSVVLTAGADAAVVTIKSGGSSGTVILTLGAPAAGTSISTGDLGGVSCPGGIHVTVTSGTTPGTTVVYQ